MRHLLTKQRLGVGVSNIWKRRYLAAQITTRVDKTKSKCADCDAWRRSDTPSLRIRHPSGTRGLDASTAIHTREKTHGCTECNTCGYNMVQMHRWESCRRYVDYVCVTYDPRWEKAMRVCMCSKDDTWHLSKNIDCVCGIHENEQRICNLKSVRRNNE